MTNLNKQILEMIQSSEGHLTAEEAFMLAKKKHINVSMASIYRILNKLYEEGLINKVSTEDGPDIFDKTINEHGHLVCDVCGGIIDFEILPIKKVINKEVKEDIKSIDLKLHYICEKCKSKK